MSDCYKVMYSPEALDDIRRIYTYIAFHLRAPDTAQKQVDHIRKEIRTLNFMPMRYTLVDWEPWKSMKMHKVAVGNYAVYYTVDTDTFIVTIIRIFYSGCDVANIIQSE